MKRGFVLTLKSEIVPRLRKIVKSSRFLLWVASPFLRGFAIIQSFRPMRGNLPHITDDLRIQITSPASFEDYRAHYMTAVDGSTEGEYESLRHRGKIDGFCIMCSRRSTFSITSDSVITDRNGNLLPNFRETIYCDQCGFKNRLRAAAHVFLQECAPSRDASIYITEQYGTFYRWLRGRFSQVYGSEYLGDKYHSGKEVWGIRHEDLCNLSWGNSTFDFVLSYEVLEHVIDAEAAFCEILRTLKPGGKLLFSAPFDLNAQCMVVRAKVNSSGAIEQVLPAEYHGNPSKADHQSLCFRYFGWDIVDLLRNIGFSDPKVLIFKSQRFGYVGGPQVFISASR